MAAAWVAAREAGMVVVARVVRAAAVETVVRRAVAVRVAGRLEARAAAAGRPTRGWRERRACLATPRPSAQEVQGQWQRR